MKVEENTSLAPYTTFKIGGIARYLITVSSVQDVHDAFIFCKQQGISHFILGKGSNTLFDDQGFNGAVILNKLHWMKEDEGMFSVGSGYSFSLLGSQTARRGWTGLEFASGIPGSVGGAVFMNAGANGQETLQTVKEVTFLSEEGESYTFSQDEIPWRYRWTKFHEMQGMIVSVTFQLTPSLEARQKQISLVKYRTETQPYDDASAGCVFRNPEFQSAGKLIEECHLKNTSYGGARVSPLHGNFIVNEQNATAHDVMTLAKYVQDEVHIKTGVHLEMELRHIPYQGNSS
ncbi:UDP-N-acetylmuramate dehydrogenase [Rhabdochlamydiaceae symbiont of Dictyostelium giganteum]|uniref:UDP-N-acetylmuramate dehydrogenase n=1 Tax=Rhabdochlamydiaceae symbiont of Dictyostelium giganteum TaxID=3342349 RepID=UPI00384AFC79